MKIAIPVKLNKENAAIAPLFGKAKWFAIVEDGTIQIETNECKGGEAVVDWLASMDIDTIIMQEMGMNPYRKIKSYETITLHHSGFERTLLVDALQKFKDGELELLDDTNMDKFIEHHEKRHPPHEHTHGHHQHH